MAKAGVEDPRIRALLELFAALAGDLEVSQVLARVVDAARRIFDARSVRLAVLEPAGGYRTIVSSGAGVGGGVGVGGGISSGIGIGHAARKFPDPEPGDLAVEIRVRTVPYARLLLEHRRHLGFGEADRELATALAAAAGVAIDNAELYRDARLRASWLEAAMNVGALLADGAPGRGIGLETITELARREAAARQALLLLPVGEGPVYRIGSVVGAGRRKLQGRLLEPRSTALLAVIGSGVAAVLRGLPELAELGAGAGAPTDRILVVDLSDHSSHYGLLLMARAGTAEPFTGTDREMSAVLGANIGQGLGLARMHRLREQVLLLSDRERIARDLHDVVIQRIFAAGLSIQALSRHLDTSAARERAVDITAELDETIRELRETIYALRSRAGEHEQLSSRVLRAVRTASEPLTFAPHLRLAGPLDAIDDEAVISNLLAVLTESISNAVRHAEAGDISVRVLATVTELRVLVRDDGVGMSFPVPESGLANMGQRARELGGRFSVESHPGSGTTISWRVPLP